MLAMQTTMILYKEHLWQRQGTLQGKQLEGLFRLEYCQDKAEFQYNFHCFLAICPKVTVDHGSADTTPPSKVSTVMIDDEFPEMKLSFLHMRLVIASCALRVWHAQFEIFFHWRPTSS